jgi:hypothetical protein
MASKRAKAVAKPGSLGGRGMKKGLVKVMFSVDPRQLDALRREATLRMVERRAGRIDTSEVVREALSFWIQKHGR